MTKNPFSVHFLCHPEYTAPQLARHSFPPKLVRLLVSICVGVFIGGLIPPSAAQAHGGVIIDSGFTEQYEWLVAVDPFPVAAGETVVTFLIYDLEIYAPINELTRELYLAPPSSSVSCCNVEQDIGPLELETQPELYPGDDAGSRTQSPSRAARSPFRSITVDGDLNSARHC